MFQKILIGVDGSEHSNRAVDAAIDLAQHYQTSVILMHVIRNMQLPKEIEAMIAAGEVTESRMEILQDSAELILDRAEKKFQQAGVSSETVSREVLKGDPASTLANYAENHAIDLIIIGFHGLDADPRLLGSVARKLSNISTVSCLIVK
jgi:nucleotide-binding universal stress UspA family protein